jgi:hypothetical protein
MTIDGDLSVFAVGCAGGALAELLHWWNLREAVQLPAYARSPLYWGLTLLMVLAGGFIAWIYFGAHAEAIIAVHVGLSTPLILQKLVTSLPADKGAKNIVTLPAPSIRTFFTW